MTQQQKDNVIDIVKAWSAPMLLAMCGFFLAEIYTDIKEIQRVQNQMIVHDERRNVQIIGLQDSQRELKEDIRELKKTVEED